MCHASPDSVIILTIPASIGSCAGTRNQRRAHGDRLHRRIAAASEQDYSDEEEEERHRSELDQRHALDATSVTRIRHAERAAPMLSSGLSSATRGAFRLLVEIVDGFVADAHLGHAGHAGWGRGRVIRDRHRHHDDGADDQTAFPSSPVWLGGGAADRENRAEAAIQAPP